jgi:hypothetical protein
MLEVEIITERIKNNWGIIIQEPVKQYIEAFHVLDAIGEKDNTTIDMIIVSIDSSYLFGVSSGVDWAYRNDIEERYKTEMNAIKKGHDERWAAIDYANKLLDIEEQVLNARLKLAGLSISGVTKGTLEQARKDLKKIQEEQQKLIEKEAVDRATKELEQQMQNELMVIQTQLRESLDYLGAEIQKYAFVLTETTEITAGSAAETNQNFVRVGNEIARAANVIEDSTTKLNDTNIVLNTSTLELNSSVIKLTRVMLGKEGTKAPVETQDTDQKDYAFVSMERI